MTRHLSALHGLYAEFTQRVENFGPLARILVFIVSTTISFPLEHFAWEHVGPMHELAVWLGVMSVGD